MNAPGGHEKQKRSMLKQYATYCITSATCCMDRRRPEQINDKWRTMNANGGHQNRKRSMCPKKTWKPEDSMSIRNGKMVKGEQCMPMRT